jgi:hypothetical protein
VAGARALPIGAEPAKSTPKILSDHLIGNAADTDSTAREASNQPWEKPPANA